MAYEIAMKLDKLHKETDGKCQRCNQKVSRLVVKLDYVDRMICSHCDAIIRSFMCNNFPTVPKNDGSRTCREQLNTLESFRAVREFMMKHPELDDKKLRKNSKLRKELTHCVGFDIIS